MWRLEATRTTIGGEAAEKLVDAVADAPKFIFDLIRRYQISCEAMANGVIYAATRRLIWQSWWPVPSTAPELMLLQHLAQRNII